MSNFNLTWLAANFENNIVVFDIGCADLNDTLRMKAALPNAKFYAFDCAETWRERNIQKAHETGINYFHMAMSDTIGTTTFYPSDELDNIDWPWSGSICQPSDGLLNDRWKWGNGYTVSTTTLTTFCNDHNVIPDVIHIDVQGAEYKVFSKLGDIRPSCIWAEISEFNLYDTGVTYDDFNQLMISYGYSQQFKNSCDALYVLDYLNLSKYQHE